MSQETQNQNDIGHSCPYCGDKNIETIATAPYVRGFLLAYQMGYKSFIGCVSCVRKKLFGEAGLSALVGWFSITSLIINPFLIIYNLFQGAFLKSNPAKVKDKLNEMGIPLNPAEVNLTQIGYTLAAAMVLADGKVEAEEIKAAEVIGEKIFDDFDEAAFHVLLKGHRELPDITDIARMLKDYLDDDGKKTLFKYLLAIAKSDGTIAPEEKALLVLVAQNMGMDMNLLKADGAAS